MTKDKSRHVSPIRALFLNKILFPFLLLIRLKRISPSIITIAAVGSLCFFITASLMVGIAVAAKQTTTATSTSLMQSNTVTSNSAEENATNNSQATVTTASTILSGNSSGYAVSPANNGANNTNEIKTQATTTTSAKAASPAKKTKADSPSESAQSENEFLLPDYQDPGEQQDNRSFIQKAVSGIFGVVKYLFYLVLVLAIGFGAIYGVKLFNTKYGTLAGNGGDLLNIMEVKYLAPGKALCLVEVAGKVFVIGMAGNNINHLGDIAEQEKVDFLKHAAAKKKVEPMQPFQVMLDKFSKRDSSTQKPKRVRNVRKHEKTGSSSGNDWKDDIHTTGDNIRKLLEEIKEQDTPSKRPRQRSDRDRGDDRR